MSSNDNKCTTEKRPKMLKEFLQEINNTTPSNSSILLDQAAATLPRSRSRSRAAVTSFHKLLSAVKSLRRSTTAPTPPSILPRSLSWSTVLDKWSLKKKTTLNEGTVYKVKVKDILRWRSFRDVAIAEDLSNPLDSLRCEYGDVRVFPTTATPSDGGIYDITTTTTVYNSCNLELVSGLKSSPKSSWGESADFSFTMDELPCWWGNFIDEAEKWDQNNDVVATVCAVGPKEENQSSTMEDEKEQNSPISVLDSPFREELADQEFGSLFDKSLANMERTKQSLLQSIQWLESLAGVSKEDDETELLEEDDEPKRKDNAIESISKNSLSRVISKFLKGEHCLKDKEVSIKEMENERQWSKFEEVKSELGVEFEVMLLTDLVNEVLIDVFE